MNGPTKAQVGQLGRGLDEEWEGVVVNGTVPAAEEVDEDGEGAVGGGAGGVGADEGVEAEEVGVGDAVEEAVGAVGFGGGGGEEEAGGGEGVEEEAGAEHVGVDLAEVGGGGASAEEGEGWVVEGEVVAAIFEFWRGLERRWWERHRRHACVQRCA